VIVWQAVDWIEEDSGIDITPCHDGGQWNPTFLCQGFPQEPWTGGGNYTGGCEPGPAIGFSEMCGPPLDDNPDAIAPVVAITSPEDGTEFQSDGGSAAVQIVIEGTDEGWGMASIDFTIRTTEGDEQNDTRTVWDPWVWDLNLPPGGYIVTAIGHDNAENTSEPAVVSFGVDEQAPDPDDIPDDTGTGDGTGTGGGDGDGAGDDGGDGGGPPGLGGGDSDRSGCGCTAAGGSGIGAWLGLVLLALPARRRRR
jgi:MYXO-CTERM domain-containing protein